MSAAKISILADRGVVSVTGSDAGKLLQGLITNDIEAISGFRSAIHTGLLSPQGKILFDFFVLAHDAGYLLDVPRDKASDLVKRLTMYKLRADVNIQDVSPKFVVLVLWGLHHASSGETAGTASFIDPRNGKMGLRILAESHFATDIASATNGSNVSAEAYHAHRIALGIPEGSKDYDFGDAYPHEANFDIFNGVSFTKGCYVGQEVVARMHNKSVVKKRVVKVTGAQPLTRGADIMLGDVVIGRIGSVDGTQALALLRLDRADDALTKGQALSAGGADISVDPDALTRYRTSAAARASSPGMPS